MAKCKQLQFAHGGRCMASDRNRACFWRQSKLALLSNGAVNINPRKRGGGGGAAGGRGGGG